MKSPTSLLEEMKAIVENDGLYYEKYYNMSPVLARVFAYLVLTADKGLTFDEIKETLQASKSTISTCLSTLTDRKMVEYFTKPGDRKRYFKSSPLHFLANLERELEKHEMALKNQKERIAFKLKANTQIDDPSNKYLILKEPNAYNTYLNEQKESAERLLKYIKDMYVK